MNIIKYVINTGTREPQWITMAPSANTGQYAVSDTSYSLHYMLGWGFDELDVWLDKLGWTRDLEQQAGDSFVAGPPDLLEKYYWVF